MLVRCNGPSRDDPAFFEVLQVGPGGEVSSRRIDGVAALVEVLLFFWCARAPVQHHPVPLFEFCGDAGFRCLAEPLSHTLIGRIGFDRLRELGVSDAGEFHQPEVHRAGVDVFTLGAGQHGTTFVDHARKVHVTFQLEPHAPRKALPEIHGLQQTVIRKGQALHDHLAVLEGNDPASGREVGCTDAHMRVGKAFDVVQLAICGRIVIDGILRR